MDKRKDFISTLIIKTIVLIFFLGKFIVTLVTLNSGVIIGEENDILIYSMSNYNLIKIGIYVLVLFIVSFIIYTFVKAKKALQLKTYDDVDKKYNNIELSLFLLVFLATITTMVIFPLGFDDTNNYVFSLSLAAMILALSYLLITLYNKYLKVENSELTVEIAAEGAMMVALAVVLSITSDVVGLKLPYGGSISLSMLPLFVFALRKGVTPGLMVGFLYGLINFIIDGMFFHWGSIFFDYLIPFTLLAGFAGLFSKKALKGRYAYTIIAVIGGGFLRYIFHGFSGVIFFGQYMPDTFDNVWFYSFIAYNLPYMAISTAITLVVILLLHKQFITKENDFE